MSTTTTPLAMLVSLDMLTEQCSPAITPRMLKHWRDSNLDGFRDRCVMKIGRRLLFDRSAVEVWMEEHRGNARGEQEG